MTRLASSPLLSFILVSVLALLPGCMPRGETKTLDELLASGKAKYEATLSADKKLSPQVSENLKELNAQIASLLGSTNAATTRGTVAASADIAETLSNLTMKAGYTSRPGLGSLAKQFRSFEEEHDSKRTNAKAKLLVARTYETLASEIATTGFRL